ncbi:MAG: tyrosine-type recombinase/integrase [Chlamydiae bacterium]|nr:tyrosine-type recombinase/integrase [Chlamydiota bacterium]MBI3266944.1 tyrosine-type recombinase/integrase [Chlamydiota bacterium]
MSPEHHIQRFLEETKTQYKPGAYDHIKLGLRYYLEYLKDKGKDSIHVDALFINSFREHLYLERGYHRLTAWEYVRGVRDFYRYLKSRDIIQESPVLPYRFTQRPIKERSYTDREILRAYLTAFRKRKKRLAHIPLLFTQYRKLETLLTKYETKLQTLDREILEKIAKELDLYPAQRFGTLLYRVGRTRIFHLLKSLIRWSHQNGYRGNDPTRGFKYAFSEDTREEIIQKPCTSPHWQDTLDKHLSEVRIRLRKSTILGKKHQLEKFFQHLTEIGIEDIQQISLGVLEKYRNKIYENTKWSDATKWAKLGAVKAFMDWCERTDQILTNPTRKMTWPKHTEGLHTRLMNERDIKILLHSPDMTRPTGIRNRAIFELMYSTGSRVGEASSIRIEDIDFEHGLLKIENPKGGPSFQRIIPIGEIALHWVKRYLDETRLNMAAQSGCERLLFLSEKGGPISGKVVNSVMRRCCHKSGMRKTYSSHSWRVSCATGMLKNHADIRHIQEQLGHRSLSSTQIYTRILPLDLKKAHEKTHPREKEARRGK